MSFILYDATEHLRQLVIVYRVRSLFCHHSSRPPISPGYLIDPVFVGGADIPALSQNALCLTIETENILNVSALT